MIHFQCEHCHRPVRVADRFAGKRGRCPHCQETVSIPRDGDAIGDLAAALGPDTATAEDSASRTAVPPPPAIAEKQIEEDLVLPDDDADADLDDTVVLPAEQAESPPDTFRHARRHRQASAQRRPPINPLRVLLLAAIVIVVLAAAVLGISVIYVLR